MKSNFFKYSEYDKEKLPDFGFKIHISSTIDNYKEITDLLIPYLDNRKIAYKYIYQEEDIIYNYSIKEDPFESGKLFTIYPENREDCIKILEDLYEYLPKDLDGIYILSDRNFNDSNIIFYRYGTIKFDYKKTLDGLPVIYGPNGEAWQDYPKNYFDLPFWIEDIQSEEKFKDSYLSKNYEPIEVLKYSNGGNIYKAKDIYGKFVVIKESRANILSFEKYLHRDTLENEYNLIENETKYIAESIEKVEEWINRYYIYQYIDGEDIYYHLNKYALFNYKLNDFSCNINMFKEFVNTIVKLLELVNYFHNKDIVLNDIHSNNIIYFDNEVYFIDFGNSYLYEENQPFSIYNETCLKEWTSIDGKLSDIKKLGNLILYCMAKLHIKNEREIDKNISLLNDLLKIHGIESNLHILIKKLLENDINLEEAINSFKNLSTNKSSLKYELTIFTRYKKSDFNFYKYENLYKFQEFIQKYNDKDIDYLKYLIDKENMLGIIGLSGYLLYIFKDTNTKEIVDYGINSIINKLIKYNENRIIPIRENTGSPYIDTGNAGFIKLLIAVDKDKYRNLIIELSENLISDFAQRPGYYDGMLGIADTLIDVYELNKDERYIFAIKNLLLNTIYFLKYNKVNYDEYFCVHRRYNQLIINFQKNWLQINKHNVKIIIRTKFWREYE